MEQITNKIIMVRPANFGYNEETADDNAFQNKDLGLSSKEITSGAIEEFDTFVELLREHGISVEVIEDTDKPRKPDAIFPNNWFTTHDDGTIITYPMYAEIRRLERREDIVELLSERVDTSRRYSFEYFEEENKFLEGTGSMILDRKNRIVYACLSERTHVEVLDKFSVLRNYKKIFFKSVDPGGDDIYHTNVMMTLGENFVLIGMESIKNEEDRKMLLDSFKTTEKEVIELSYEQLRCFAGNMLQLRNKRGERFVVMSKQAKDSLNADQINSLENHGKILSPDIKTIETSGGGSVRCMIAEDFLPY